MELVEGSSCRTANVCRSRFEFWVYWGLWVAILMNGIPWSGSEGRFGSSKLLGGWQMKHFRTVSTQREVRIGFYVS